MASSGRRDRHPRTGGPEDLGRHGIPVVACDYAFFRDGAAPASVDDEDSAPIIITKCDDTKMIFADVVFHKGVDPWALKQLVDHIQFLGHPEIRLRSDGEPAIKALMGQVAAELKKS